MTAAAGPARLHPRASLAAQFRQLGVRPGGAVPVHAAMRPLGFVCGGPQAVVLADRIVADHSRADMLGEVSPLARLYGLDADVLLLGVDHGSNTSLHLAEYRQPAPPRQRCGAAVPTADGGGREWVWWDDVVLEEGDFARLGADFEATGAVRIGPVGDGTGRLMRQRAAVDFAVDWLARNRRTEET
ncbi:Aminoglycoside 3-N-acetyltransferase [Micromonospora rhizosphaerae]|uniref:Aminoglycoside N(3)-acetyltransferase n=1 Tax=Micromonospora rhizosphaerae TaxID=568872 RepID=A0A1C6T9P4_9ACTN|nr:AAC(3) family N-acetyltransferase [Micromonospora rhizosphaerae]SCL38504.1 Aminoglycoside 3-N-acetyltransferase [Micromonospora rhizosphaerae]